MMKIQRLYDILSNPVLLDKYGNQLSLIDAAKQGDQERIVYPKEA